MTRQLRIANVSNHENEDYLIEISDQHGGKTVTLKPGEETHVNAYSVEAATIIASPATPAPPYPFLNKKGQQTIPMMRMGWGNGKPTNRRTEP